MRKSILFILFICIMAITFGCIKKQDGPANRVQEGNVSIQKEEGYYTVTMDLSPNYTRKQTGENYGRAIEMILPEYEQIVDSYIGEVTQDVDFNAFLKRINDIKGNLPKNHAEEIEGLSSVFSGKENVCGDGRISKDEIYFISLISDILRETQCSAVSAFGDLSSTGNTITGRNLDWFIGREKQLAKVHAVTIINDNDKSVCLIGVLGYLGCVTGFNDDKVFAAMLDAPSDEPYSSENKNSYAFDMRYALENMDSMEEIASYMMDSERNYTFNHLFFLSDENKSMVLENNFSGNGTDMRRSLRASDSDLNESVSWGIQNAVCAVNSFLLKGNHDNHSGKPGNFKRWESLRDQVSDRSTDGITVDEIKEIIGFDGGDGPGRTTDGDVYWLGNVQTIIFQPAVYKLEIAFAPPDRDLPADPVFLPIFDGNPFK